MANIVPDSFKQQLFLGTHNFSTSAGNTFQLALYSTVSVFTASGTTAYTTTNEASGTGYSAGGLPTNTAVSVADNIAFVDFSDVTFSTATITASAALIYNTTVAGTPAVVVLDFGGDKTSTNGDFTIQFPDANSTSAILRIS